MPELRLQIVTFPFVFLTFFVIGPGWLAAARYPAPIGVPPWLGVVLFAAGLALYLWTILLFARAGGTQVPIAPTQRLVTTGPYAVTRNPMVTSAIVMITGLALVRDSWSFLVAGLVLPTLYLLYLKLVEEHELEDRFGADYVAYKATTPFLLPRLRR